MDLDDHGNVTGGKKTFVLCFDGTGNKFSGTDDDSNILKVYRMLDRSHGNQFHYYQPGIGTYVTTSSMEHTSVVTRFKSWYDKAKDSAVGTSFATHVMGGYRFLMRYYTPEDDIYFFGFSRGAYTARFLAEMLDHVGLLSAGNEELTRFAWKTFSKWQSRRGGNGPEAKEQEDKLKEFMANFRDTFSRPVRRIRFLGLFDTVNSVPRFENAWMQRSKFPYTATSSAKVIRHAVSINERRAKFRQDLVTGSRKHDNPENDKTSKVNGNSKGLPTLVVPQQNGSQHSGLAGPTSIENLDTRDIADDNSRYAVPIESTENLHHFADAPEHQEPHSTGLGVPKSDQRRSSLTGPMETPSMENLQSGGPRGRRRSRKFSDHRRPQDIEEVWFPGCHADIGGGWPKEPNEKWQLSHAPLVWMVHEAEKAGLKFDNRKLVDLNCCPDKIDGYGRPDLEHKKKYHDALHQSGIGGFIHDCLAFGGGLPHMSVLSWKMMEYLPFRRMDLQDGNWKAIRWPLPGGETRDIPDDAKIHVTAIERMKHDPNYRPGNLIIGGGGRGVKVASKDYGIAEWDIAGYEGDPVREYYIRKNKPGTKLAEKQSH